MTSSERGRTSFTKMIPSRETRRRSIRSILSPRVVPLIDSRKLNCVLQPRSDFTVIDESFLVISLDRYCHIFELCCTHYFIVLAAPPGVLHPKPPGLCVRLCAEGAYVSCNKSHILRSGQLVTLKRHPVPSDVEQTYLSLSVFQERPLPVLIYVFLLNTDSSVLSEKIE